MKPSLSRCCIWPDISSATFSVIADQSHDLVVAFAVGDRAVQVLLLYVDDLLFGVFHQRTLIVRNDHVINANRESSLGRVTEPEVFDFIEHLDRRIRDRSEDSSS